VPKVRRSELAAEESAIANVFDPYSALDSRLDAIEKHHSLSGSTLDKDEARISSGMLTLDLILGGGIVGGGWYTLFGLEQSCKSTAATTIMTAALNTKVPVISYMDYEGCCHFDTNLCVNGKQTTGGELIASLNIGAGETISTSDLCLYVATPCGNALITSVTNKGPKPITRVVLEDESYLSGYRHPVLVCTKEELLEWRYLEDLQVGDLVVAT